jgi:hypothetical protein
MRFGNYVLHVHTYSFAKLKLLIFEHITPENYLTLPAAAGPVCGLPGACRGVPDHHQVRRASGLRARCVSATRLFMCTVWIRAVWENLDI